MNRSLPRLVLLSLAILLAIILGAAVFLLTTYQSAQTRTQHRRFARTHYGLMKSGYLIRPGGSSGGWPCRARNQFTADKTWGRRINQRSKANLPG